MTFYLLPHAPLGIHYRLPWVTPSRVPGFSLEARLINKLLATLQFLLFVGSMTDSTALNPYEAPCGDILYIYSRRIP
jgi:hypothetical protein